MDVVFLEVDPEDREKIETAFPKAAIHEGLLETDALVEEGKNAEALCCFIYTDLKKDVLAQLPNLKIIVTRSVGYNHIDLDYCDQHGILVCNVPDYGSHVIAEHVFALLLSTLRHVSQADKQVEEGNFDYHGLRGMALKGKTMGIIGTGKIGRNVAKMAHGFGMNIVAVDVCRTLGLEEFYGVKYVDLDQLLTQSEIITLHVPALKQTQHMMNSQAFSKMRDGVILVNTARGELIDSKALLEALTTGKVGYALLDVLEHEKNFENNEALIQHPRVVTTPHIAFYADDSMNNMYHDAFTSLQEYQEGKTPSHSIKPEKVVCDLKGIL